MSPLPKVPGPCANRTNGSIADMAKTFYKFPDLPSELRLLVWKEALLGARDTRTVVLYDGRVVPFKHLISTLLSVNQESRRCAQAFYHVKLDVYKVPPALTAPPSHLNNRSVPLLALRCDGVTAPPTMTAMLARRLCHRAGLGGIRAVETTGRKAGRIYISPEQDTLVVDFDCGMHFCVEGRMRSLGRRQVGHEDVSCHHISAELPTVACRKVSSLIRVNETYSFSPLFDFANRPWNSSMFPNLRYRYEMPIDAEIYDSFLSKIVRSGGRLPFSTERRV